VQVWEDSSHPYQIWKLIPVKAKGAPAPPQPPPETLGSGSIPPCGGDATGQPSTQYVKSEHDGALVGEREHREKVAAIREAWRIKQPLPSEEEGVESSCSQRRVQTGT